MCISKVAKWKYLALFPILYLLASVSCFEHEIKNIHKSVLHEKLIAITDAIDMLAAAVEANPDQALCDHESTIHDSVEYLDGLYQIYGAVYKYTADGKLTLITSRNFETSIFEATDYPKFIEAINAQDSGNIVIGYKPAKQDYRDLYIYFRWMPRYAPQEERFLVVVGVSKYSIVTKIPEQVSSGIRFFAYVTALLNLVMVAVIIRLSVIVRLSKKNKEGCDV